MEITWWVDSHVLEKSNLLIYLSRLPKGRFHLGPRGERSECKGKVTSGEVATEYSVDLRRKRVSKWYATPRNGFEMGAKVAKVYSTRGKWSEDYATWLEKHLDGATMKPIIKGNQSDTKNSQREPTMSQRNQQGTKVRPNRIPKSTLR